MRPTWPVGLSYWRMASISEPFMETSKVDGKTYLVQHFKRQRFEYHPRTLLYQQYRQEPQALERQRVGNRSQPSVFR